MVLLVKVMVEVSVNSTVAVNSLGPVSVAPVEPSPVPLACVETIRTNALLRLETGHGSVGSIRPRQPDLDAGQPIAAFIFHHDLDARRLSWLAYQLFLGQV